MADTAAAPAEQIASETILRVTLFGMPEWAIYLLAGLVLMYLMGVVGVILGRTGRSPLWAVLVALPILWPPLFAALALGTWFLAFSKWTLPPYLAERVQSNHRSN